MAPELFSEEIRQHQCRSAPARTVFPFRRQIPNPAKEVFEKLSGKLKERDLLGVEYAQKYLFLLYSPNRRPNTLDLNYRTIGFFLISSPTTLVIAHQITLSTIS